MAEMDSAKSLTLLENADLVRPLRETDRAYTFRHALTQESAYGSLMFKSRREIHRRVAAAYESLYPERLDEFAARLADHYAEAGDRAKTLVYAEHAGDVALRVYAVTEAVGHYTRALENARQLGEAGAPRRPVLYRKRGRALELGGRFADALANYTEMEAAAQAAGDRARELAALMGQANLRCTANAEFDPVLGEALTTRALALAEQLNDRAAQPVILWNRMNLQRLGGRMAEARATGERSLRLGRELGISEPLAYTLNDLGHVFQDLGLVDQALTALEEASALWRSLDNRPMLADSLATSSGVEFLAGGFARGIEQAREAFAISQSIGNAWGESYSHFHLGMIYFEQGRVAEAIAAMEYCIARGTEAGFFVPQIHLGAYLGWIYGELGDVARGLTLAHQALERAQSFFPYARSWVATVQANLYLMAGNPPEVATVLAEMDAAPRNVYWYYCVPARIELARRQNDPAHAATLANDSLAYFEHALRFLEPDVLYQKGRALMQLGRRAEAEAALNEGRARAEVMGSRRALWPILAALGDLAALRGDPAQAQARRAEAQAIVEAIASHTPPELRALFLARAEIQALNAPTAAGK